MSSSRLPGKVLEQVSDEPMIFRQIERVLRSSLVDELVVLTSTDSSDDDLAFRLSSRGIRVYRGDLSNVYSRFTSALRHFSCEVALRLTADCPLIDPEIIDATISSHVISDADYTSNSLVRKFPRGLDCEVFKPSALLALENFGLSNYDLEHVTSGIYSRPGVFVLNSYENTKDESHRRWTVDYPRDLEFVRTVYGALYESNPRFTSNDVRELLERQPELENLED